MSKKKIVKKIKKRNIAALSLQLPQFRQKIIVNKKKIINKFQFKNDSFNNYHFFYVVI